MEAKEVLLNSVSGNRQDGVMGVANEWASVPTDMEVWGADGVL